MTGMALDSFEIRAATSADLDAVCALAGHLNTVNLPNDPSEIAQLLLCSERSFRGEIEDVTERQYVFILWDTGQRRAVGTAMIIGQLGRRGAPYIYFDVRKREKYSSSLDRHFIHDILSTTYSYDGPTELGGLVVDPGYRRRPERLGSFISYVRFLFIAMRRADFRDRLLAELLPPITPDGKSQLWEAVGHRFTGLSYREADLLSRRNKEFIKGLFPDEIHATLLSPAAREVIGQVGEASRGVEKMLRKIGFSYANRVDPFDGGPHFLADTDRVSLIQASRPLRLAGDPPTDPAEMLVAAELSDPPHFKAIMVDADVTGDGQLRCSGLESRLALQVGERVWAMPLEVQASG